MGVAKTLARVSENFSWPGLRMDVTKFVAQCVDCQLTKYETKRSAGLLCPLPVPQRPWEDLSLDFILGLPPYQGHSVILVVGDRFSKGIHLGTLPASHTAHMVAVLFMEIVGKIHGIPRSLVSDRDPLFLSNFWREVFKLSGTQLRMSSAYHPQSDGQTEVMNRIIEQCLRAFVHRRPRMWGKLLLWVEWSHITSWNAATGSTPFEITFGRKPFNFPDYITGTSRLDAVDEMLKDREETFQCIRKKLLKAQAQMKKFVDMKRRDMSYQPGDWVLLKFRPRRQSSVKDHPGEHGKLANRFYGPFKVLERVGSVAYRLELPENARVHPVFHCSVLKLFQGPLESETPAQLPDQFLQDQPLISPLSILDYRRLTPADPWQVLVQWKGLTPDDTTWEDWDTLQQNYHLEDKVILQGPPSDSITIPEVQTADASTEQTKPDEVQIARDTKRRVSRPKYLKDYV